MHHRVVPSPNGDSFDGGAVTRFHGLTPRG